MSPTRIQMSTTKIKFIGDKILTFNTNDITLTINTLIVKYKGGLNLYVVIYRN